MECKVSFKHNVSIIERMELVFKIRVNSYIEGVARIWQKPRTYYEKERNSGNVKQMNNVSLSDGIVWGIFMPVEVHRDS